MQLVGSITQPQGKRYLCNEGQNANKRNRFLQQRYLTQLVTSSSTSIPFLGWYLKYAPHCLLPF